jgi:hypothetical protein
VTSPIPPERREALDRGEAPIDYAELLHAYHGMVLGLADRMGIGPSDREDAAAEVELRFWRSDGLAWYDPDRVHQPPPGGWRDGRPPKPRTARFGGMFRRYAYLNMLQERDRHSNRLRRAIPTDHESMPDRPHDDHADSTCRADATRGWIEGAAAALDSAGHGDWARILPEVAERAAAGDLPNRAELSSLLGRPVRSASSALAELGSLLTSLDCGPDDLREAAS